MKQAVLHVSNPTGLHARPATVLVRLAKSFKSEITIRLNERTANAKSMIAVLALGADAGSEVEILVEGEDEDVALAELEAAIRSGLGEGHAPAPAPAQPAALPTPTAAGLRGAPAAPGIAIGPVFQYRAAGLDLAAASTDPADFHRALGQARAQLTDLHSRLLARGSPEEAAIFEAHAEILADPGLSADLDAAITAGTAPAHAWDRAIEARAALLDGLPDPLLAARAADLRDAGRRVLRCLLGVDEEQIRLPAVPVIVIAAELSPSETASFDPGSVLGFATTGGGPTAHVAILARALGLPAVVAADPRILDLPDCSLAILDGDAGLLEAEPSQERRMAAEVVRERRLETGRQAAVRAFEPAVTLDGHRVSVTANAGSIEDARAAALAGAEAIGLLRTEFLFLGRVAAPSEDEQAAVYRAVAEAMRDRPVTVRTLDIGGDKPLAYVPMKPELNPFLGERGLRLCLNRPELFREQLRAILRAAQHGQLKIMFPMVSELWELRAARAIVDGLCRDLGATAPELGIMVEVPSAALLADVFAAEVDFFSIGTNDLTQYTLAMDRGHPALAARQDGLHPAVLRLIARTIAAAHEHGKRVDVCGELAADPAAVPVLLGLGIDELSVNVPSVPAVKALVRGLTMSALRPLAQKALACASAREVRELVGERF